MSCTHYYDIKSAIEEEGLEGLLEKSRKAPRLVNRVAPEIEQLQIWILLIWNLGIRQRSHLYCG